MKKRNPLSSFTILLFFLLISSTLWADPCDRIQWDQIKVHANFTLCKNSQVDIKVKIPESLDIRGASATIFPGDETRFIEPGIETIFKNLNPGNYTIVIGIDGCLKKYHIWYDENANFVGVERSKSWGNVICDVNNEIIEPGWACIKSMITHGYDEDDSFTLSFSYLWDFGDTSRCIDNLPEGTYDVLTELLFSSPTIPTESVCSFRDTFKITKNQSSGGYEWDFGDSPEDCELPSPMYEFDNFKLESTPEKCELKTENPSIPNASFGFNLPDYSESYTVTLANQSAGSQICQIEIIDQDQNVLENQFYPLLPMQPNTVSHPIENKGTGLAARTTFFGSPPLEISIQDIKAQGIPTPPSIPLTIEIVPEDLIAGGRFMGQIIENSSITPISICQPDTLSLRQGFFIYGGSTPYTYNWDLDGDGMYDDDTTQYVKLVEPLLGIHQYGIEVVDFYGARATAVVEVDIVEIREGGIVFPDHGGLQGLDDILYICFDDGPVKFEGLLSGSSITGSGMLNDSIFDPDLAGVGVHVLIAEGPTECDQTGFGVIYVQPEYDPFWDEFDIAECDEPINLFELTADTTGFWIVGNDTIDTGHFDPFALGGMAVNIRYELGINICEVFLERTITVKEEPVAQLVNFQDSIENCDTPLNLISLLHNSATPGGTWSGGDYVLSDEFDPAGLNPGLYPVVYSVGEGNCENLDTIQIKVITCLTNNVKNLSNELRLKLLPNPNLGKSTLEVISTLNGSLQISIFDVVGNEIFQKSGILKKQNGLWNIKIDLSNELPGVYFIQVRIEDRENILRMIKL